MSFKYKEREVNKTLKTVFLHITDELPCATTFSLRASGLGPGSALGEKGEKIGQRSERRDDFFARRYFSYLTSFFGFLPFFPHYGTWSEATGFWRPP